MKQTDVIVVGGGVVGCATAYHLAEAGARTILIEKHHVGHGYGGSSGRTRMYRQMYSDPYYSELATTALAQWQTMAADFGRELLRDNGLLFYGNRGDEDSIEGNIPGARSVMRQRGIPFIDMDIPALRQRWPIDPPGSVEALFEPSAGTIWSARAMTLMATEATRRTALFREGETVVAITPTASGSVRVRLGTGDELTAASLVLATSVWTNPLLAQLGWALDLQVWPMLWAYYEVDPALASSYPQWFRFSSVNGEDGGLYYGFPVEDDSPHIKVGVDWCPERLRNTHPDAVFATQDQTLTDLLDRFLHAEWNGIGDCVERHYSPYSMTSDNSFVLDRLPDNPHISVFAGDCGHAFKFAPLLGRALADLALDRPPPFDLTPMNITRAAIGLRST